MSNDTGFNHQKAANLLFSEKNIASGVRPIFREGYILFHADWEGQLARLIQFYQEAFLREKLSDTKWLGGKVSSISKMCTEGFTPFVNPDPRKEGSNLHPSDMTIPLNWLNQKLVLKYCQTIDNSHYYEARIMSDEELHGLGNRILYNLMFEDNDLKYALRPAFESITYTDRLVLPIRNKEGEEFHTQGVVAALSPLVSEIFKVFGEKIEPKFKASKIPDRSQSTLLTTSLDQIGDRTGSVNPKISTEASRADDCETTHLKVTFDLADNQFSANNRALSQLRGVEAMNLFKIRFDQLKREVASS